MPNPFIVKVTTGHPDWTFEYQSPQSEGVWGDYRFIANSDLDECDFWVVCDTLYESQRAFCAPEHVVLVTWEPETVQTYPPSYTHQFASVITTQEQIRHRSLTLSQTGLTWRVGRTYDQLKRGEIIHKPKALSIISSDKQFTEGHKKRYDLAIKLKNHFGDQAELFGRGIQDFDEKWDVLAPYRYSLALENVPSPHWITEKLSDCFLTETFPLYHGAPNAGDYYPQESFSQIDLYNFEETVSRIESILSDDSHYERHRSAVIEAKHKLLDFHNIYPLLARHLGAMKNAPRKQRLRLRPLDECSLIRRAKKTLRPFIRRH